MIDITNSGKLTDKKHWDETYNGLDFYKPNNSDPIRRFITRHIKKNIGNNQVFEIGCFPGRYLSVFGDLNYQLNGIDLVHGVKVEMVNWLKSNKYLIGDFFQKDFLLFSEDRDFNIVCSFGFIEHFTNYQEIIMKHLQCVSPGGYLIITTPNFNGRIQKFLHSVLDFNNLKHHNLLAMDPYIWREIIESNSFSVLYCGWIGGFDFWADEAHQGFIGKFMIKMLNLAGKVLRFLPLNSRYYSPYSVILAKRNI